MAYLLHHEKGALQPEKQLLYTISQLFLFSGVFVAYFCVGKESGISMKGVPPVKDFFHYLDDGHEEECVVGMVPPGRMAIAMELGENGGGTLVIRNHGMNTILIWFGNDPSGPVPRDAIKIKAGNFFELEEPLTGKTCLLIFNPDETEEGVYLIRKGSRRAVTVV
ncbi:MAG: hypothetical protein JW861_12520 [Bacteroidales bacterium]|nr:hypothetical protein [Bacteroidales bacterium]